MFSGLFDKAKRKIKILGKEIREDGAVGFADDIPVGGSSALFDAATLDRTTWEPQELGERVDRAANHFLHWPFL